MHLSQVLRGVPLHPGVRELELQVQVSLRSLSLDLLVAVNDEPHSLLALRADGLSAGIELYADDFLSVRLALTTFALEDSRAVIRPLLRHTPLGNAPAVHVRLSHEPHKTTRIEVEGGGVSFLAAPDSSVLLAELGAHLAPRVKAVQRALEQREQRAAPEPPTSLAVTVTLRTLTVRLPLDLARSEGKCVALVLDTAAVQVADEAAQAKVQVHVSGLSVAKLESAAVDSQQYALLRPVDVRFESISGADTGMHGTLRVSSAVAMVSMRDVKLLLKALQPWLEMDALLAEPATELVRGVTHRLTESVCLCV